VFFIVTNVFLTLGAFAAWFFFILVRKENILFNIGFALFISGAIGNLYDRIAFGYVRDFINLPFFPPVFNIADACLTIGTGVFIFAFFVGSFKKVKNAA
jgi:signal peptidase II